MRLPWPLAERRPGVLSFAVIVLAVYVLVAPFASTIFRLPPKTAHLLSLASAGCGFFLVEFSVRCCRAEHKLALLQWGYQVRAHPAAGAATTHFGVFYSTKHLLHHGQPSAASPPRSPTSLASLTGAGQP